LIKEDVNKVGVVVTLMIGTLMAALDMSVVNVSIPAMMEQFHSTVSQIELVVSSYMIGFVIVMPMTDWLKNRLGYYKLYLYCLIVFIIGSLLCGIAWSLPILVAARIVQAFGGGALTPVAMAILATLFDEKERGKVLGLWGLGVVVGPAFGPTIGGMLTEKFGWPSIFLINIPIGLTGIFLTQKYLRATDKEKIRKIYPFDWSGFLSFTILLVSFFSFIGSIHNIEKKSTLEITLSLMTIFVSLGVFLKVELTKLNPMINLKLFNNLGFFSCITVTFLRSITLYGGMFLIPLYLQLVMNYSETKSGILMFPGTAFVAAFMPFAGKWADRFGPTRISVIGLIILALAMYLFSTMGFESNEVSILARMSLRGIALGLVVAPITVATMNAVSKDQFASASAFNSIIQQIGGALGVAALAIVQQHVKLSQISLHSLSPIAAELKGISFSFRIAFVIILVSLVPCFFISKKETLVRLR